MYDFTGFFIFGPKPRKELVQGVSQLLKQSGTF